MMTSASSSAATRGAWFGDPELKASTEVAMKEHRAKDELERGSYMLFSNIVMWSNRGVLPGLTDAELRGNVGFKGCALGCMLYDRLDVEAVRRLLSDNTTWHGETERVFGIPEYIAWAIDNFFESRTTFEEAAEAAVAMVEAIPVGADYSELIIRCSDRPDCRCIRCRTVELAKGPLEPFLELLRDVPIIEPVTE